jgi:hypothetical protein
MSLRILGSLLLLTVFTAFRMPVGSVSGQEPQTPPPYNGPKWEYNVVRLGPSNCTSEGSLNGILNELGLRGWELVSYEPLSPPFTNADGTILIRPAATGAGRDVQPQLADSFQGNINMRMGQPDRPLCRVLFKRPKL